MLLLPFIISFLLIFVGCYRIYKYQKVEGWAKHEGTILDIQEKFESVPQQYYNLKYVHPEIKYEYTFNDTDFISSSVSPHIRNVWLCEKDNWGSPLNDHRKFWHGWQKETKIGIFVNPNDPAESYVVKDQSKLHRSHNLAIVVGGVIVLTISIVLAIYT